MSIIDADLRRSKRTARSIVARTIDETCVTVSVAGELDPDDVVITDVDLDYSTPLLPGDTIDVGLTFENQSDFTLDSYSVEVDINDGEDTAGYSPDALTTSVGPGDTESISTGTLQLVVPSGTQGQSLDVCARIDSVEPDNDDVVVL